MLRCISRQKWPSISRPQRCGLTSASRVYLDLEQRGLVESKETRQNLLEHLSSSESSPKSFYCGIDPTAPSLHVGHLLPLMVMLHFSFAGHQMVALVGGATGLVGDPSGRDTARPKAHQEAVASNSGSLEVQLTQFFRTAARYASERVDCFTTTPHHITLNNASWHSNLSMLDFLREVGNYSPLRAMLARESVKRRLESKSGMMFTELSYQLLQAYDFYWLYKNHGCTVQIGGADQWGNILAGCDLISRKLRTEQGASDSESLPESIHGIVTPLLTTSTGVKIGKSEGNAIWLDRSMTSIYDFYQYFLRVDDRDVASLLKKFTLLPLERIDDILDSHNKEPEMRSAQRILAAEVTEMMHGRSAVQHAEATTKALFADGPSHVGASSILDALSGDERLVLLSEDKLVGQSLSALAGLHGLVPSKTAAKALIKSGGFYINGTKVVSDRLLDHGDFIEGRLVVLRAGKTNHRVLACSSSLSFR